MNGVIVGSDITQEWLLPWWWHHYNKDNKAPVAFIDFGMSFEKKEWCRKRGKLIPLRMSDDFVKEKKEIDPALWRIWEEHTGTTFWDCRKIWFKKPFACLKSPFNRSVWIDLDCEIRGSLTSLFAYADQEAGIAMLEEIGLTTPIYNAGVIAFRKPHFPIQKWADSCLELSHSFRSDEEIFSHLVAEKKIAITKLPALYNWSHRQEIHDGVRIRHWHGPHGKRYLKHLISQSEWVD